MSNIQLKKKQLDKKARKNLEKSELKRRYYKFMRLISLKEKNLEKFVKYSNELSKLPLVKFHNFCYLTGRGKGVLRDFRLARHQIKEKFQYLHGLTNSSW